MSFILNVANNPIMPSVIMLSVIVLSVIMLNVIILNVVAPGSMHDDEAYCVRYE